MLKSVRDERERRFKLALRTGVPILLLVSLLFYVIFIDKGFDLLSIKDSALIGALVFVIIYFIYFLLGVDVAETLLDHNTHTYNYDAFLKKIKKKSPKSVAIIRINNLSLINDNYGTESTNALLAALARNLHTDFRKQGIRDVWIGRKIGAGFLLAVDTESKDLQEMLDGFIEKHPTINNIEIDYRFGIVEPGKTEVGKIINLLGDTLNSQESKPHKKYTKIKDNKEFDGLEEATINALENESLNLYFRPLYSIKKQKIDSYELAIKLKGEDGKEMLPRDYLPIVNRLGLGQKYDLSIFKRVVDTALLVDDDISFSFNISPFSLRNREFLESIFAILRESGIHPNRLIIELYERKTHHNLGEYLKTLSLVRSKGIQISIDNFGSSNASMEYLKHFKFDRVQFDRDFVTKLNDSNSISILKSLIDMCKEMNITTVAKWVDRDDQKAKLTELGIDYLQGFGVGKQLTEHRLIQYYNK